MRNVITPGLLALAFAGVAQAQNPDQLLTQWATTQMLNQQDKQQGAELRFEVEGKKVRVTMRGNYVQAWVDGKLVSAMHVLGSKPSPITLGGKQLATIRGLAAHPYRVLQGMPELGVNVGSVDTALAQHLEIEPEQAVIVLSVHKGKAAEKAGLKKHDIVLKIDEDGPVTRSVLTKRVQAKKPGDKLKLRILRRGEPMDIVAVLGKSEGFQVSPEISLIAPKGNGYIYEQLPGFRTTLQGTRAFLTPPVTSAWRAGPPSSPEALANEIQKLRMDLDRIMKELKKLQKTDK